MAPGAVKKALLVCYGGGHANIIAPVHERLLADGRVASTVLALSVAKRVFRERELPFKTPLDYADFTMDPRADAYGEELAARWHADSSGLSRRESAVYFGASMRDLVDEVGEDEARARLDRSGRRAFLPIKTLDRIVDAERPDVIVTTNSPRMERAATLVGNQRGIPTLNVHDDLGFIGREYVLSADRIAVMSEITKQNLVLQGHDASKIVVTGHPAFDRVPEELRTLSREALVRKFGLPVGPYVLFGTSWPGERGAIIPTCPSTCDAVAAVGGLHLIVKPHPAEDANAYRAYAATRAGQLTVVSGVKIRELLFISELLITFASTTMIESVLMDKPIVSYNDTSAPDPLPYVKWGLGIEATTPGELQDAIRTIRYDEAFRQRFAEVRSHYFSGSIDGRATERVVDLIHCLAGLSS